MRPALGAMDRLAFERFVDVVNRALVDVRSQFPYSIVIGELQRRLQRRPVLITIRGAHAMDETPVACLLDGFALRWVPGVPATPAAHWVLDREHVLEVIDQPWRYVADPTRIRLPPFSLMGRTTFVRGEVQSCSSTGRR